MDEPPLLDSVLPPMLSQGIALMESGRPKDAVVVWENLLKRFPDDPQLQGLRAQIERVRAGAGRS